MLMSTPLLISFLDNPEKCTRKSRERATVKLKTKDRMRFLRGLTIQSMIKHIIYIELFPSEEAWNSESQKKN